MNVSTADWNEFAPPPPRGRAPALSLALLAHLLLLAALAWGLNWKRQADTLAVDAELWAAVPTQAAPRAQAPPQPVPKPAPKPAPAPVPKPAGYYRAQEQRRPRQMERAFGSAEGG